MPSLWKGHHIKGVVPNSSLVYEFNSYHLYFGLFYFILLFEQFEYVGNLRKSEGTKVKRWGLSTTVIQPSYICHIGGTNVPTSQSAWFGGPCNMRRPAREHGTKSQNCSSCMGVRHPPCNQLAKEFAHWLRSCKFWNSKLLKFIFESCGHATNSQPLSPFRLL